MTESMRKVMLQIASGYEAQLGARRGGVAFAVLAGVALERGWVRTVKRRDGTRPYALTPAGRAALNEGEGQ